MGKSESRSTEAMDGWRLLVGEEGSWMEAKSEDLYSWSESAVQVEARVRVEPRRLGMV